MRDNSEGSELDPVVNVSPAQVRGQQMAVTVAAKSGQFTAGNAGKDQFLQRIQKESGKRENCEKDFVSR